MTQHSERAHKSDWVLACIVIVAVLLKLWLTSDIKILSLNLPHDSSNFIEHAKSILEGHWFGDYNQLTLIKQPFYPIYLAIVQEFGLPLPLANELVYALACVVACIAVRPIIRNPAVLGTIFVVTYFDPFTFGTRAWLVMRSDLNLSLALFSLACAVGVFIRRRVQPNRLIPWLVGLGVSFAAFWQTREEAFWLVPCLLALLAAYIWYIARRRRDEMGIRLAHVGLPVAIWAASIGAIMLINGLVYGWYTTNEQWAPEFVSAFQSISRIETPTVQPFVNTPRAAREIAYQVSPSARELKPYLEGPVGYAWTTVTCSSQAHICNDIGGGWFEWALRDAVAAAGHAKSGNEARTFYIALARELDAACDSEKIRCRPKGHSLLPPIASSQIPGVFSDLGYGAWMTATLAPLSLAHGAWTPYLPALPDYQFVVTSVDPGKGPNDADDGIKWAVLGDIAQAYQRLTPFWIGIVLLAIVLRIARCIAKRSTRLPDHVVMVVSVLLSSGCLLAMLSLLNTFLPSRPGMFDDEYMTSPYPMIFFALAVATAVEAKVSTQLTLRRRPSPGGMHA